MRVCAEYGRTKRIVGGKTCTTEEVTFILGSEGDLGMFQAEEIGRAF